MPEFKYVVKSQSGDTVTGALGAANEDAAVKILKDKKFVIISLYRKKGPSFLSLTPSLSSVKIKTDDLAVFARQLAIMVDAGLPLVQSLDILREQSEKKPLRLIIGNVKESVEGGSSLSEALSKYPKAFSELFINMISAGEASGMLDEILSRMATYLEDMSKLQKKVKSALVYPAAIIIAAIGISVFMLVKVVPTFEQIYAGFGADLPGPTKILLNLSRLVTDWLFVFLVGLAALCLAGYAFSRSAIGSILIDRMLLSLPIVGKIIKKVSISRFSRTLSTLTRSGVSILSSLEIVAKTSGNKVIEKAILKALESVKAGETIAQPLARNKIFPPLVVKMVAVGEQTGALEEMLHKIADFYDSEVTAAVDGLTSLIEPVIIVLLGIFVGGMVIALYLPVFNIAGLIN